MNDAAALAALDRIARHQRLELVQPVATPSSLEDLVAETARLSRLGYRKVTLEEGWHRGDAGVLLGTCGADPVALIPRGDGRGYRIGERAVRAGDLDSIDAVAYEFYPGLPGDDPLTRREMARFALAGLGPTVGLLVAAAVMIGLLGLLGPIVIRHVFGTVIPAGETSLLYAMGFLLCGVALVSGAFAVVQGFAVNRLALKALKRLQPAVWHRVLSLPVSFFRRFPSGELTVRILSINRLWTLLSASAVGVLLSATFSLFNLMLILLFDPLLAVTALAVVLAVVAVTLKIGRRILGLAATVVERDRASDAHFSDVLEGMTAIRIAAAEQIFLDRQLDLIGRKVEAQAHQQVATNRLHLFYATAVVALPGIFFAVVGWLQWNGELQTYSLSSVTFVAFMAAFNTVLGAFLALSTLIQPLSSTAAILDGIEPVQATRPEVTADAPDPGELSGSIELRGLSFRYPESRRQTLTDVSFEVAPGEFVALVGPSGAGKSTLVRLLLGFESPEEGAVLFDGHDLKEHDVSAIRSQMGVVLQDARVFSGSIRDNIAGARAVALDEVWQAADNAGIGDDIRAMPMGLETIVSPDGSTFSGGQIQRLMIARALISKPKILILDEATSNLDDLTQEIVTESIDRLDVTRIVLAHRLSTIRRADKILVIESGHLVEQGSYDELLRAGGLFSRLVARQVL